MATIIGAIGDGALLALLEASPLARKEHYQLSATMARVPIRFGPFEPNSFLTVERFSWLIFTDMALIWGNKGIFIY